MQLKTIREKTGLSITDFWAQVGVKTSTGYRYEKENHAPLHVRAFVHLAYLDKKQPVDVVKLLNKVAAH